MLLVNQIVQQVLIYLDGWAITDENKDTVNESPYMTVDELQKHANKYITSQEIITFYDETSDEYRIRLNYDFDNLIFDKIICKITAGRLWNKYNIHTNTEDEESSYIDNYGKKLITEGEKALKPFTQQRIRGFNGIK